MVLVPRKKSSKLELLLVNIHHSYNVKQQLYEEMLKDPEKQRSHVFSIPFSAIPSS